MTPPKAAALMAPMVTSGSQHGMNEASNIEVPIEIQDLSQRDSESEAKEMNQNVVVAPPFSLPDDALMQSMVKKTPAQAKSWHKELLFGLFSHSDDAELARIASLAKAPKLSETAVIEGNEQSTKHDKAGGEKRKRDYSSLTWNEESCEPSRLSLVPYALQKLSEKSDHPAVMVAPPPRNARDYRDLPERLAVQPIHDIDHLERIVNDKFHRSDLGREAVTKRGPDEKRPKFEPFSLAYNEVSMSGIAAWALQTKDEQPQSSSVKHVPAPAPAAMFRQCGVCSKWGHYDTECQKLTADETIALCQEVSIQKMQQTAQQQPGAPEDKISCEICKTSLSTEAILQCHGCSNSFHRLCANLPSNISSTATWFCDTCQETLSDVSSVAELEGCEGFVIEQRKRKRTVNDEWRTALGIRCFPNDNPDSDGANEPVSPATLVTTAIDFVPGDLCWTRRDCADSKPLSADDDWWPSEVRFVSMSTDGQEQTYLVKRLATWVTRARASTALPFLEHFERLGCNRVYGDHPLRALDASQFERALDMAVVKSGFESLHTRLQEARESSNSNRSTGESSRLRNAELRAEYWDNADETVQDGFLLRAKKKPATNVRVESSTATPRERLVGSTVAWSRNDTSDDSMCVGTVLALNLGDGKALVKHIPNWQDSLPRATEKDAFIVNSSSVGASTWMGMEDLHLISPGASLSLQTEFSKGVLPSLLDYARRGDQDTHRASDTSRLSALGPLSGSRKAAPTASASRVNHSSEPATVTSKTVGAGRSIAIGPQKANVKSGSVSKCNALNEEKETPDGESVKTVVAKKKADVHPRILRERAWRKIHTSEVPSVRVMSVLLNQRFGNEDEKSPSEIAVITRFKRGLWPKDILYSEEKEEWKLAIDATVDTGTAHGESRNEVATDFRSLQLMEVKDAKLAAAAAAAAAEIIEASPSPSNELDEDVASKPSPVEDVHPRILRERAWRKIHTSEVPSARVMSVLLNQRFGNEDEKSPTEKAVTTRFKRGLWPKDILYSEEKEEWKLAIDATVDTGTAHGESRNEVATDFRPLQLIKVKDAKLAAAAAAAAEIIEASPSPSNELDEDVASKPSPVEDVKEEKGPVDEEKPKKQQVTKQGTVRPNLLREKAWRRVVTDDIPSVHWMSVLLNQCFDDEPTRSQKGKAITTRFKRGISPEDVIYNEERGEWKLAPDSNMRPETASSKEDTEGFRPVRLIGEEEGTTPAAAAVFVASSAMLSNNAEDEGVDLNTSPAEGAEMRRERGKRKRQDGTPFSQTGHEELMESSSSEGSGRSHHGKELSAKNSSVDASQASNSDQEQEPPPPQQQRLTVDPTAADLLEQGLSVVSKPSPVEDVKKEKGPVDQESPEEARATKQDTARPKLLREKAWRRVDTRDIPSVRCMSGLLNQCFDDEPTRSQKDKAITSRFKRGISPEDVIYNEERGEWKLAPDSNMRPETASSKEDTEGFRPVRLIGEEEGTTPAAAVFVASSAMPSNNTEDEDVNLNASPAERAKMRSERGKQKVQDGTPVSQTGQEESMESISSEESGSEASNSGQEEPPPPQQQRLAVDPTGADLLEEGLSVATKPSPVVDVKEEKGSLDQESPKEPRAKKRDSVRPNLLREKAWRRVDTRDIPSVRCMSVLLNHCFDDEPTRSQNDKAIKSRFKRGISPEDVIYNEEMGEWKLAPDSNMRPETVSSKEDTEGFRPVRLLEEREEEDTKPAAAAVTVTSSAMPSNNTEDEDVDLNASPAERAKMRRERGKRKVQDGNPVSQTGHEESMESSSSEESGSETSTSDQEEPPPAQRLAADPTRADLLEQGLYVVEDILDDRQVMVRGSSQREYLIKWKGFGTDECTWEPKKSLMDPCLVERYDVNKIYDQLNSLPPDEKDSTTMLVIEALKMGRKKVEALLAKGLSPDEKRPPMSRRMCPFCRKSCSSNPSPFGNHLQVHQSSKNFALLKEAALVIREEWYD